MNDRSVIRDSFAALRYTQCDTPYDGGLPSSLPGGTTWQSVILRLYQFVTDCFAALRYTQCDTPNDGGLFSSLPEGTTVLPLRHCQEVRRGNLLF